MTPDPSPTRIDHPAVALLLRIQRQDRDAHQQLYRLYRPRLHAYAAQLMQSEQAADDIVQEVFERIWRYAPSFCAEKARHPDAWIFQIARNQALTEFSRLARFDEWTDGSEAEGGMGSAAVDAVDDGEHGPWLMRRLGEAQLDLPHSYRQVVFMRFHLDLTLIEIAGRLGIPLGTVKTWLRRALIRLRELMHLAPAHFIGS